MDNFFDEKMQKIRNIENKYLEVIFKIALQFLLETGSKNLSSGEYLKEHKHRIVEAKNNIVSAEFIEQAQNCAIELAGVPPMELIRYIKDYVSCNDTKTMAICLDYENDNAAPWDGSCPRCEYRFTSELIDEYRVQFCPECGQAIKTY